MKDWRIEVSKITDVNLLRIANEFTSGKESKQSLKSAYRSMHSTVRTQIFLVRLYDIPQYVGYHFRTHFSLTPMAPEEYGWMFSKRPDKGAEDFRTVCGDYADIIRQQADYLDGCEDWDKKSLVEMTEIIQQHLIEYSEHVRHLPDKFERYAPTDFAFTISAEGLVNMASKRLCVGAVSKETREVMEGICEEVRKVDPDLYPYLVKPCIATGACRESECCGFIRSGLFKKLRYQYKLNFVK